jgi:hypothetical protein
MIFVNKLCVKLLVFLVKRESNKLQRNSIRNFNFFKLRGVWEHSSLQYWNDIVVFENIMIYYT